MKSPASAPSPRVFPWGCGRSGFLGVGRLPAKEAPKKETNAFYSPFSRLKQVLFYLGKKWVKITMEEFLKKSNYYREEDKPMAIDPKEIKSIEDSMVHDIDEEPKPE